MTVPVPSPYPEQSQATAVLALGIIGVVLSVIGIACCILAPLGSISGGIAWYLGRKEITAIQEGRRNPEQLGMAKGGMVTGIVATILGLLMLILFFVLFGFAINAGFGRG